MTLDKLFGNDGLKATLRGFASRRAFPNSFIISGPEGSGKTTVATLFAMAIACRGERRPCGGCEACRKISEGISPDVITVALQKDRRTLGIETVRELRDTAYILPNDLDSKIYIIKDAEKLTEPAQNALLKIFEEGPRNVYFILLTANSASLLPTVRSRAPEMKTEVFSDAVLTELLRENSAKANELYRRDTVAFNRMINASGGSYGKALSIIEGKNKRAAQMMKRAEELVSLLANGDGAHLMLALIDESGDREGYTRLLTLMQSAFRDLVAVKRGGGADLIFYPDREAAAELSESFSLYTLIKLTNCLDTLIYDVSHTNINVRNAAVVACDRLVSAM